MKKKKGVPAQKVKPGTPPSVDAYLKAVPEPARSTLKSVRRSIKAAAPKATEGISYQIPTYKFNGMLVSFAAFKQHCSLFPLTRTVREKMGKSLEKYQTPGSTLRFPTDAPLSPSLVKKFVGIRLRENERRVAMRSKTDR